MTVKKICGASIGIVKRYYHVAVGAIQEDWDGNVCLVTPGCKYWPSSAEDRSDLRKCMGFYTTFLVKKSDGSVKDGSFGITGIEYNRHALERDVEFIWESNFAEYF